MPHTSAVGPNQSPQSSIKVVAPRSGITAPTSTPRASIPTVPRNSPVGVITAEMPVLAARTCGRRDQGRLAMGGDRRPSVRGRLEEDGGVELVAARRIIRTEHQGQAGAVDERADLAIERRAVGALR